MKKYKTFSERGFVPLKMTTELENIDIDTQEDFDRAKKLLKNIKNKFYNLNCPKII